MRIRYMFSKFKKWDKSTCILPRWGNKAIILKSDGSIIIVILKHSRNGQEPQNKFKVIDCTLVNHWIPIVPDYDEGQQLDKEWEENDYSLHSNR